MKILVVGGAGKTPAAIALADRLRAGGRDVHVVLRGHGGRAAGPLRVVPGRHGAGDVGDEALLHAAFGPTRLMDPLEAVEMIHGAGGLAVWAHPPLSLLDELLPALERGGLDGLEVYRARPWATST